MSPRLRVPSPLERSIALRYMRGRKQSRFASLNTIIGAARTGEIGDGRVFVTSVTRSYKIRTGEKEA